MTTVRSDDKGGGVRLLTLDRPPANAITPELLDDLSAALAAARDDDHVRAVVVTGAGRFFSGGLDLSQTGGGVGVPLELYRDSHVGLLSFPKPTVAMVNGHAIAGGLVILLACDYRLGVEGDYKIGLNEVAIGASFPKAAFEIVRLRLSDQRASELLLGAALYPISEALRLGVVDELLTAATFEETVLRRAARLGSYPKEAYAHTKAALVADAVARTMAESPDGFNSAGVLGGGAEWLAGRLARARTLGKG
jgi:enoyl-CoA hydratase